MSARAFILTPLFSTPTRGAPFIAGSNDRRSSLVHLHTFRVANMSSTAADPGPSIARQASSNGDAVEMVSDTLEACAQDSRGFPARTFGTRVLRTMDSPAQRSASLSQASRALRLDHAVAFPTETVYGLGANALSSSAVLKIFAAKGRPADNPLIVHISDLSMLHSVVDAQWKPSAAYRALFDLWPAPMTLLCPARKDLPSQVTAGHPTVAVRIPQHELARELISLTGLPLAAPSANASGRPSPTSAAHVMYDLGGALDEARASDRLDLAQAGSQKVRSNGQEADEIHPASSEDHAQGRIPFIVDGGSCSLGVESTVIDGLTCASELRILRPGGLSVESIQQCLRRSSLAEAETTVKVYGKESDGSKAVQIDAEMLRNPTTPGMKYRHYSPDARVVLVRVGARYGTAEENEGLLELLRAQRTQVEMMKGELRGPLNVGLMSLDSSALTEAFAALCGAASSTGEGPTTIQQACQSSLQQPVLLHLPNLSRCPAPESDRVKESGEPKGERADIRLYRFSLGSVQEPGEAARRLFEGLRALDEVEVKVDDDDDNSKDGVAVAAESRRSTRDSNGYEARGPHRKGCDVILVESVQEQGIGLAIMNRLNKAAAEVVGISL